MVDELASGSVRSIRKLLLMLAGTILCAALTACGAEDDEYIATDQKWAKNSGLLKDEDAGFVVPV